MNNEFKNYDILYYSYMNALEEAANKFKKGDTSYTMNIETQDGSIKSRVYNSFPEFMTDYNKCMNSYAKLKQNLEEKNRCK